MKIWICCAHCGSRDVTRDAIARWDDDGQCWSISAELDNTDCETCGEERDLEEVEIIPDAEIPAAIQALGWELLCTPHDAYRLKKTDTSRMPKRQFDELTDAYCYALKHDNT